jgi:hypothetical protein
MEKTYKQLVDDYYGYSITKCNAHYQMAEKYKANHRTFGTIVVIITALVGTSVFSTLSGTTNPTVQVVTSILSVAAVVLAALQTFLGFSDLQAQNKMAGVGYSQIRRDLDLLAAKYPKGRGGANTPEMAELESIKKHLDDLDNSSPTIPDKVWDKIWKATSKKKPN